MEGCFRVGDDDGGGTVVGGCVALAEVVGLDGGGIGADLFLEGVSDGKRGAEISTDTHSVNLVEVVRLEDVGADNAGAVGSSQIDIDMAKEDVEIALDGGCIALL